MTTQPTRVPLLDPARTDGPLAAELEEAFRRVLQSGRYILGPEVEAFEQACAAYMGVEHAIAVSSGTDAILLALMALDIGAGDEVICPSYTFFATAGCIARTGARPVFIDSLPGCLTIDPEATAAAITDRTKAIIPVHLYGQCADMQPILDAAAARGIPVIEDAAQAIGASYEGRQAGALALGGCFSFYPTKNLGGFGDGGLLTSGDAAFAARARSLRLHGESKRYHHDAIGGNFRMDAIQAALLGVKLPHIETWTEQRRHNAARYDSLLEQHAPDHLTRPAETRPRHVYHQYVVRVAGDGRRDRLHAFLAEHGVSAAVYYPIPLHLQACFASLGHRPGDLPIAEAAARETLALPIFPGLAPAEIERVVERIAAFLERDG